MVVQQVKSILELEHFLISGGVNAVAVAKLRLLPFVRTNLLLELALAEAPHLLLLVCAIVAEEQLILLHGCERWPQEGESFESRAEHI